ncbi:MAG: hypothetical protein ACK5TH_20225 [Prosthecobacter sp.]
MSDPEDINPYAAPQSQTLLTRSKNNRPRRPVSVKWAFVFMFTAVVSTAYLQAQLFPQYGWRLWTDYLLGTFFDSFRFFAFFALLVGGNKPWVFWTTTVTLTVMLYFVVMRVIRGLPEFFELLKFDPMGKAVECLALFLVLFLLYRFAFGQPSRLYFGLPLRWSVR